ncbi:hypothetical protein EV193_106166 [Herbihabitans rhizosphaerae]|uniref:Uncharacterized protein n=1 Tax=Herbihabitans rhizosphaerae TaxID=1872711 RepID=A0A4Q7KNX3_9PSEU|nr:hypothetical protein [Herbihabitans rhizosphaerae]RZS36932.1 hypothetical protein EV193_106166 [Herbihabitans rhizosphaerae]
MTARTRTPPKTSRPTSAPRTKGALPIRQSDGIGWQSMPPRLRIALAVAAAGALFVSAGAIIGVDRTKSPPSFASAPLLVVLALLPIIAAAALTVLRRAVAAAGVLIGAALLAAGRALIDLQIVVDPLLAARPELFAITDVAKPPPGVGPWLLIAGHVAALVAGLLAAGRAGSAPGSPYAEEFDDASRADAMADRRPVAGWALAAAGVAALGLVTAPFGSDNAFVVGTGVLGGPALATVGTLLAAAAVLAGAAMAASAPRPGLSAGVLIGTAVAVLAIALPAVVAATTTRWLHVAWGPVAALVAALALLALAWRQLRVEPAGESDGAPSRPVTLDSARLHQTMSLLGLLTGAASLAAARSRLLVADAGIELPVNYSSRLLVPAGVVVGLLGLSQMGVKWAPIVRPALVVASAAVVLAGASALDTSLTALGTSDVVRPGSGTLLTAGALLLAAATACCGALAGGAERDDVDVSDRAVNGTLITPVTAAVVLAVGAFGAPILRAAGYTPPGLWSNFRLASWGLLVALAAVIAAAVLALASRPPRAAALLLGAATVVAVRALEPTLTSGRVAGATPGTGTWLSAACAGALVIAAVIALTKRRTADAEDNGE